MEEKVMTEQEIEDYVHGMWGHAKIRTRGELRVKHGYDKKWTEIYGELIFDDE